jgi:hypothetical protein
MEITSEMARLMARAGGLALSQNRAGRIAPFVGDAIQGADALAELDMQDAIPSGPPWGFKTAHD